MQNLETELIPLKSAEGDEVLKNNEIIDLIRQYAKIQLDLQSISMEQKVANKRQDTKNQAVEESTNYNLYITIFEMVVFMGFAGFQVYYIQNLLDNKRLLF